MIQKLFNRTLSILGLLSLAGFSLCQQLSFLGNTTLTNTGLGTMPSLGGFIEPSQTISITTQTYPISQGQTVTLVYTTDGWNTSHTIPLTFDFNTGNNSQWYAVLGPLPPNTDVLFYLEAQTTNGIQIFDNNGNQNYGFISRFEPKAPRGAILQWFATNYTDMIKWLPIVALDEYGALYLPPPEKAGGGGFSVGYNPFDRFDLGSRFQGGTVGTQYGTSEQLQQLIQMAHRFGIQVYCDTVLNHNDNRASTAIDTYPNVIPEDFHIFSSTNTTNNQIDFNNNAPFTLNLLNGDLAGLADIAHEDGNLTETGPFNLPSWATFNGYGKPTFIRQPLDPQYYPNAIPTSEDVRQYLERWSNWLTNVIGFDGLRLDAVREIPPAFFNHLNNQAGFWVNGGSLLPPLYGSNPNLFVFGEDDNQNNYEFREYVKSGMDLLDFPLFNTIGNLFNSNGFGDLGASLGNGYGIDSSTSLTFANGGLAPDEGVSFVQSHDYGPPTSNNLAYAFTLTDAEPTIVYFDGNNLDPYNYSQFPKPGRYDSLGYQDSRITNLVDARARFGRGNLVDRYTSPNLFVYERQVNGSGILLVGLNNRGDSTALSQSVQTAFAPGTTLVDLSHQEPNLTVATDGTVTMTVPSNGSSQSPNNGTGYVVYVPQFPSVTSSITVKDANGTAVSPTSIQTPAGTHGGPGAYQIFSIANNSVSFQIPTDIGASAFIKVDNGVQLKGTTLFSNTAEGLTDGYFKISGNGPGFSSGNLNLTGLPDGMHLFRIRVFDQSNGLPGVYQDFPILIDLQQRRVDAVNGNLSTWGNPITTQTVTPTSQSNRLDEMFVWNDDSYIYIGLAGQVDSSTSYNNGAVTFIDTSLDQADGYTNFGAIADDGGEAGRLMSDSAVQAPSGFSANFGLVTYHQSILDSSFNIAGAGAQALPSADGAMAGLFALNPNQPGIEHGVPVKIAWMPRLNPFGTPTGLAAAIPIGSLFPNGLQIGTRIGLLSYLTSTGESGTTLEAHDPNRATLGGRPKPLGYVLNQFLPPQPGITSDPGTNQVQLSQFVQVPLQFALNSANIQISVKPLTKAGIKNTYQTTATLVNQGTSTLTGPIYLVIHSARAGISVQQSTGPDYTSANTFVVKFNVSNLAPNHGLTTKLMVTSLTGFPNLTYSAKNGPGIP